MSGSPTRPTSEPLAADATVVIVGASLAGLRAAEELRHDGHTGPVVIVGDEVHAPYDRPPLSKQVLAGKWDAERIRHHAPDKLDTLGLDLRLGLRATGLDAEARAVHLADGSQLPYDGLLIATGARARTLPGVEGMAGVHVLRTLDDCLALKADLEAAGPEPRLVVVGAGFIGAEVAATGHGLGAKVTLVEALPVPLGRVLGDEMGEVCAGLHGDAGVKVRAGVGVDRLVSGADVDDPGSGGPGAGAGGPGRRAGSTGTAPVTVHLTDGTAVEADVVVIGIGVAPATGWLEGSGLVVGDGVVCSDTLFAADRVVGAGDVARWTHRRMGEDLRIEHWTNAAEGGPAAVRNLMAGSREAIPYEPVPFFWSDQYSTKIQVVGRPRPDDEVVVVGGSADERKLIALYRRGDRLSAALGFSMPRQLMGYRPLLEARASFDEALAHARS